MLNTSNSREEGLEEKKNPRKCNFNENLNSGYSEIMAYFDC